MVQVHAPSLLLFFSVLGLDRVVAANSTNSAALIACQKLRTLNPPPLLGLPGSAQFNNDTALSGLNAEQNSTCSIEPRSPQELVSIVSALSYYHICFLNHFVPVQNNQRDTGSVGGKLFLSFFWKSRSPTKQAKGNGHNYNKGFASTTGVQIALKQMNSFSVDPKSNTASFGPGNAWSDVFPQLEEHGVMTAGGRIAGVGEWAPTAFLLCFTVL